MLITFNQSYYLNNNNNNKKKRDLDAAKDFLLANMACDSKNLKHEGCLCALNFRVVIIIDPSDLNFRVKPLFW